MGCVRKLLLVLALFLFADSAFAQVSPTPTPTPTAPCPLVTARLTQVSSHLVIACTVKDSTGLPVPSKIVSVQKAPAVTGPFAVWMSKKTNVNGRALLPYVPPTYTWYVRCAAACSASPSATTRYSVSQTLTIKGQKPRPSPIATPRPTVTATVTPISATYTLSVSSPAANATVKGTIQIVGQAPGFLNVEVSDSSGTLLGGTTPNSAGAYTATVDTTRLANGTTPLTINAWDSPAGQTFAHTAQATLTLNVSNPTPNPTASPQPTGGLPAPIADTSYHLVWSDEFNGTSYDTSKWEQTAWGRPVASHWANFSYNTSNVSVANGNATITIHNTGGGPGGTWTGGVLSTQNIKKFQYGFIEVRAKLPPSGPALWPAIWLFDQNSSQGELDIMEWVGNDPTHVLQSMHDTAGGNAPVQSTSSDWSTAYHLYQMRWEPGRFTYYIDNVATRTWTAHIPSARHVSDAQL